MASDLENKIIRQIEYYFGDINLPRDKFLREKVKEDDGWVTLEVLLTFKRLATLSGDPEVVAGAIEKADNKLVEVSEDHKKIRRNPDLPPPELNDDRKKELISRTAYAKGFGLDDSLNDIMEFLETHGPMESCSRRNTKDHKFKGSCFIIFKDADTCKKFIEAEELKYKDTALIRKWQADYYEQKRKEYEDRIKAKKDKKQAVLDEKCKKLDYPKGAVAHFSGIAEGKSLTREEIKQKITDTDELAVVSFIDFNKGDLEGHIRFGAENGAVEFLKKLTEDTLEVADSKLKFRLLEGEEETEYLRKTAEAVTKMRERSKKNSRNKRKGGDGGGGESKRRRKE